MDQPVIHLRGPAGRTACCGRGEVPLSHRLTAQPRDCTCPGTPGTAYAMLRALARHLAAYAPPAGQAVARGLGRLARQMLEYDCPITLGEVLWLLCYVDKHVCRLHTVPWLLPLAYSARHLLSRSPQPRALEYPGLLPRCIAFCRALLRADASLGGYTVASRQRHCRLSEVLVLLQHERSEALAFFPKRPGLVIHVDFAAAGGDRTVYRTYTHQEQAS